MDADYKRAREEKYRSDSKHRLSKILRKKIQRQQHHISQLEELRRLWQKEISQLDKTICSQKRLLKQNLKQLSQSSSTNSEISKPKNKKR